MARILPFQTRAERLAQLGTPVDEVPPTPAEVHDRAYSTCLAAVRGLVEQFRATKYWTSACEPAMIKVVEDLREVCSLMAKETTDGPPNAQ